MTTSSPTPPSAPYAVGDAVQAMDDHRTGTIVEITDKRVRIAWKVEHVDGGVVITSLRRTWMARNAFGKRWGLLPKPEGHGCDWNRCGR